MDSKALYTISYGMYVITAKKDGRFNGQTANTVFQITSDPKTIAISINKQNLTHEYIKESNSFLVSVLSKDAPLSLIGQFGFKSGRDIDKFENIAYKLSPAGLPYLTEHCLSYMEAKVTQTLDLGTHTIFIGTLTDAAILANAEPMTYAYYHEVKRGTTPKTAPTYVADQKQESKPVVDAPKYQCTICNYIYDPAQGDPEHGIAPGTSFENLPDDWICPICGAGKDAFEKM